MKNIKSYEDFYNEEINLKKAAIGAGIVGGLLTGGAYLHDKSIEPTELVQSQHVDIPNTFKLKSKILTFGTDMYVTNDNRDNFGKIEERLLSWGKKFEYKDNTGNLIATAKEEIFTWATKIDISDSSGKFIGSVEQEIIESMFSWYSIYSIKNADGDVIAKSKKLDFWTTNVDIFDNDGNIIANFSQEAFTISDKWDVSITGKIDKRLIIFIPSFISSSQSEKEDDKSDDSKK